MSKSASGSRETQNSQTGVDKTTQDRMTALWNAGQQAGNAGPSPLVTGAADYNAHAMHGGDIGMDALTGNPQAVNLLMNPYQSNVIGGINSQWDQNDQHTMNAVNDRATQAGAFGGSRYGVATGTALAQNNMNRNQQVGGLLYGGYNDAMQRAAQMQGMGAQAGAINANLGLGGVGSPEQWRLQMLQQGYAGPTGTTSSGAKAHVETSAGFKLPFLN